MIIKINSLKIIIKYFFLNDGGAQKKYLLKFKDNSYILIKKNKLKF